MNSFAFMLIQCLLTIDIKTFDNSNALQKNGKIIPNWFYAESEFVISYFMIVCIKRGQKLDF